MLSKTNLIVELGCMRRDTVWTGGRVFIGLGLGPRVYVFRRLPRACALGYLSPFGTG